MNAGPGPLLTGQRLRRQRRGNGGPRQQPGGPDKEPAAAGQPFLLPAEQADAGNFDWQDGGFAGRDRGEIQFEPEAVGCFGGLAAAVFQRQGCLVRQFFLSFDDLVVESGETTFSLITAMTWFSLS